MLECPLTVPLTRAAALLGIHRNLAYELAGREEFPVKAHRIGGRWFCIRRDLEALVGPIDAVAAVPALDANEV